MTTKERWKEHHFMADQRPRTIYDYYVTGHGPFPIDMLRHDGAWPSTGEDAAKIEWTFTDSGRMKTKSIKLRSYRKPTIDRWSSFNWSVGVDNLEVRLQQTVEDMKPVTP